MRDETSTDAAAGAYVVPARSDDWDCSPVPQQLVNDASPLLPKSGQQGSFSKEWISSAVHAPRHMVVNITNTGQVMRARRFADIGFIVVQGGSQGQLSRANLQPPSNAPLIGRVRLSKQRREGALLRCDLEAVDIQDVPGKKQEG